MSECTITFVYWTAVGYATVYMTMYMYTLLVKVLELSKCLVVQILYVFNLRQRSNNTVLKPKLFLQTLWKDKRF